MTPPTPSRPHRLADVPLFASLPAGAIEELARASLPRRYPAGQVLWNEGDPGDALLVLEEGQVRVSRFATVEQEVVLAVSEAPAALGELALLDGKPRDATVIAQGPVAVRLVPRSVFLSLLRREPAVVEGVLRTLAELVRFGNARHADLLGLDVPGRLAKWLLARAGNDTGAEIRPGTVITLGRSQGDLAAELGTTRESLNRTLHSFDDLGLLSVHGQRVELHDPVGLAAYTG
jgi:CRP-like cAMP-binding protein